ncbi:D-alanyl-D-alanine carboxypeptidase family protein [Staphylococcus shinii]|uniref:M15 family metallopeptidase n=1 Tax=Staphylococcus shinii TaxID=2912228 RepID=UPI000E698163|nr:M15 family metallopeptidase [Staphylococcus shinii]RIN08913.1 D-alanyl-D-alanine carboxypeptidase family protein [Staphylococcus shinii]
MIKKLLFGLIMLLLLSFIVGIALVVFSNSYTPSKSNIVKPKNALPIINKTEGVTQVNGHVIVNKKYKLPPQYQPGEDKIAKRNFNKLLVKGEDAQLDLKFSSSYRSDKEQQKVMKDYVEKDGEKVARQYTAKPGESEHQTGLAFDVGTNKPLDDFHKDFEKTKEGRWIKQHASDYGFIIRYPKGQSHETGYAYEAWHLRYVGKPLAKIIDEQDTNLESYYRLNEK